MSCRGHGPSAPSRGPRSLRKGRTLLHFGVGVGVQVTRLCLWMSKFLTGLGQQLNCHPTRWLRCDLLKKRLTLNLNARMRVVVVEMRAPKEAVKNSLGHSVCFFYAIQCIYCLIAWKANHSPLSTTPQSIMNAKLSKQRF